MGFLAAGSSKASESNCGNEGFPIHYEMLHEVAESTDIGTAPLKPAAPFAGVMNGIDFINKSCNDINIKIEFYSPNSDCKPCTTDEPKLQVQEFSLKSGEGKHYPGLVVDYSITSAVPFLQDGCVDVMAGRVTSTCCKYIGVDTTLNGLTVPTT